jgi:spore protease
VEERETAAADAFTDHGLAAGSGGGRLPRPVAGRDDPDADGYVAPGGPPSPSGIQSAYLLHRPEARAAGAGRGAGSARRQVWTDLAVEAVRQPQRIPGVAVEEERRGQLQISRVRIESEEAERRVGKRRGRYITLEAPGLRRRNAALHEETARALADELRPLLPEREDASVLVVGLGNWNATPDALGPRVVANLLITRHMRDQVPEDLRGGLRSLSAVAPGVLGLTGIETGEIIRAIVDRVHPDCLIAVDALASRSIERIGTTIQIADTGIHPGSGVGNDRGDISRETLGVPVVAIGVPTVVHAFTIASDTVDLLVQRLGRKSALAALGGEEKRRLIAEVLSPSVGDLMVTPKEIDMLIDDLSSIIAAGINAAVHPKVAQQPKLF